VPPRFIAEVGANHNGAYLRARHLVAAAAAAGFSAVKFQDFDADAHFHESAKSPSLLARPKAAQAWWPSLALAAHDAGMQFGLTVFDASPDTVSRALSADFLKVSSYDLLRLDLLRSLRWRPLIVSTGMATMGECQEARSAALGVNEDVTFLHCVSSYPTKPDDANLKAIDGMQKMLGCPVGWSDHSKNGEVVERAVWRWRAPVVELHVDIDDGKGFESVHGHCWPMSQAKTLIERVSKKALPDSLRRESAIDGDGLKNPRLCELEERLWRADPKDGLRPMSEMRNRLKESVRG